jgi:effector-binding domain-containing protein
MSNSEGYIGIGAFSVITRLTRRALRLYDEKGLLKPARKEITGYRLYNHNQISRGMQLKQLSDMGFGIQDMMDIMDVLDSRADETTLDAILEKKLKEIDMQMSRLEEVRESLKEKKFLEVMDLDKNEPFVKELPSQRVVSRREQGPFEKVIPKLMQDLFGIVMSKENQQAQVKCIGPPITLYHDEECNEKEGDMEVALPITGKIAVGPEYEVKTLEGIKVVSLVHKGRYQDVGRSWKVLMEYMDKKGLTPGGPLREVYLNDPNEVTEADQLTEIQAPIK